MTPVN
jgi:hypothetical protein